LEKKKNLLFTPIPPSPGAGLLPHASLSLIRLGFFFQPCALELPRAPIPLPTSHGRALLGSHAVDLELRRELLCWPLQLAFFGACAPGLGPSSASAPPIHGSPARPTATSPCCYARPAPLSGELDRCRALAVLLRCHSLDLAPAAPSAAPHTLSSSSLFPWCPSPQRRARSCPLP
jgi:hypothetical protein